MQFLKYQTNPNIKKNIIQPKVKLPSEVFSCCPKCDSTEIYKLDGQVLCMADNNCGWNSISSYLNAVEIAESRATNTTPILTSHRDHDLKEINHLSA